MSPMQTMMQEIEHVPVMFREVIECLRLQPGQRIVDCTVGTGGHAAGVLGAIGPTGHYIGIDRDEDSLAVARDRLRDCVGRQSFVHEDFRNIDGVLQGLDIREIDGILFDLGISSYQLGDAERGFSIKHDGPLDMRMDRQSYISAYDLINSLSERELSAILKNFGEERWHSRIAHCLVSERVKNPITSTHELSRVVLKAIPHRHGHQRIHPATRTFQAFRIAVNRELEALEVALDKSIRFLKQGGRVCVISFHSLEDRIVKEKLRNFVKQEQLRLVIPKPLYPAQDEVLRNPRSRSARLRVAERIL